MEDQLDHLKKALADRYTIEREIGSGGMATVYLAEDVKHRRKVAVKVLRPELAATLGADRFVREIEIAAQLSHPHILPLYDSGEAAGVLYYVMPYVEGESLRERLDREGRLGVDEVIRLTDEIAAALSYAHERGIVHRDVKPENVMLTGGRAVVADFGIARALRVAGGERLTGTGLAVGTPAYMSPEQAVGQADVDARSDVYALGCVVYEMVAGRAPFEGDTPQALLAKHAVERAPSLRSSDASIPLFLERAVERALAKDPADRFATASEFAEALTAEMVVARVGKRWPRRATVAAVVAVVVAAAAWGLSTILGGPAYERLAVLPPTNLMNDPEQEYFVQGVHKALISELQRAGVAVIARTSVLQYENTQKPIREIADELRVDALVEPSVFRAGDSLEIEVLLVDGGTEEYLADPIARSGELRNVVALYRDLSSAIAAEIQFALSPQAEARLATARRVNPQGYDAYLKGQFYMGKMAPPDLEAALHYYELALEHDPEYALAYAGIAMVWAARSQFALVPPRDAVPQAQAAAERAVELDSTLAEVQFALAVVRTWHLWDWPGAEVAFERAIEINPNYPDVRAGYSHFLLSMKRPDEAMQQSQLAVELDPFNPLIQGFHGMVLKFVGRYDEAIAEFQRLLQTVPNHPLGLGGLSDIYHLKGMYEESMEAGRLYYAVIEFKEAEEAMAAGYAEAGYEAAMRRAADTWAELSRVTYVPPWEVAWLYAAAGEDGLALSWLERGFEVRDANMPYLSANPIFEPLRDDPRFQALLRRMNLPQ
ncbi:MAG: protein kinase [Gemmatimonadota bacterium]|nr:MAG: protein kinase [Gemmatimonadota bacterium]